MFTRMDQSSQEDWEHIRDEHMPHVLDMPNRIISMLKQLDGVTLGFNTDQLHHALQTATMARRAGADDEMIVISLIHDIGKVKLVVAPAKKDNKFIGSGQSVPSSHLTLPSGV